MFINAKRNSSQDLLFWSLVNWVICHFYKMGLQEKGEGNNALVYNLQIAVEENP